MAGLILGYAQPGGLADLEAANPELVLLLGADEMPADRFEGAFKVYIGHHGDQGARQADLVLPGAAYAEKHGTYVNTEGRVQRAEFALYPPGEAREDWKILRAFSELIGRPLPYDDLDGVRARLAEVNPVFARIGELPRLACTDPGGPPGDPAALAPDPFVPAVANYYQTDPISRASPTMTACTEIYYERQPILQAAE
jgi:NADH-quinone oxidoreductase subunit G